MLQSEFKPIISEPFVISNLLQPIKVVQATPCTTIMDNDNDVALIWKRNIWFFRLLFDYCFDVPKSKFEIFDKILDYLKHNIMILFDQFLT